MLQTKASSLIKVAVLSLLAILLLLALTGMTTGFLPYAVIRADLDKLAADKSADFFTPALFEKLLPILRFGGGLLLLTGIAGIFSSRRIAELLAKLLDSVHNFTKDGGKQAITAWREEGRVHKAAALGILAVGIILRVSLLFSPIRSDEAYTYDVFASKSILQLLSDYSAPNNHILHTLLVHFSVAVFGNHVWAIRLPALAAGVLMIPLGYLMTRLIFNKDAAVLAAGLIAVSPVLVEFSTYARGYTMVAVFSMILVILGVFILSDQQPGAWFFFILVSILGFYTIPTMLYPFGSILLWIGWFFLIEKHFKRLLEPVLSAAIVIGLTGLIYTPVLLVFGLGALVHNEYVAPIAWTSFLTEFPGAIWASLVQWSRGVPLPMSILAAAGLMAVILFYRRLNAIRPPLLLVSSIWIISIVTIQHVVPYSRVWLFLLPWVLSASAAGIVLSVGFIRKSEAGLRSGLVPVVSLVLVAGLSVSTWRSFMDYRPADGFKDAENTVLFLAPRLEPGDRLVAIVPAISPLEYYLPIHGISAHYLYEEYSSARRLIIVVDGTTQSLEKVLNEGNVPVDAFGPPMLLGQAGSTRLYLMIRKAAGMTREGEAISSSTLPTAGLGIVLS